MIALFCFSDLIRGKFVKLYTDNDSAYRWLVKGRSSSQVGSKYLALWEFGKYLLECKISPCWIASNANRTADDLSRGSIPDWLTRRGRRRLLPTEMNELLGSSPVDIWKRIFYHTL